MGIFKRIKAITTAEINGVLDGIEDPIAMLNQYIREMEQEIKQGQQALSRQIFVEKNQTMLIAETEELVSKRTRQAKLAVERGEESITRLAVQEKLIYEKQLNVYKEQYQTIKNQTANLLEKLDQLKEKYNELQHKRLLLISRANVAKSMKQIQNVTASFHTDNIAKGVARAEERILMMEAEVQAGNHMSNSDSNHFDFTMNDELEEEIQKLKKENKETA